MSQNILVALQITVVGMGLVFTAILVLWGLMAILVRVAADRGKEDRLVGTEFASDQMERKRPAAAIAVAVALAKQSEVSELHEFPLPPTAIVSAWQAVLRTRMLSKRGPTRRGPSQ